MNKGDKITIPAGVGFWDTTYYPIGGSFKRMKVEVSGHIHRIFEYYKSVNIEIIVGPNTPGVKSGQVLAVDSAKCSIEKAKPYDNQTHR